MKQKGHSFYKVSFWLLFLLFIISTFPSINYNKRNYEKLNHIEEIYGLILNNYQNSITEDSLIQFLRDGLLNNLDPFTQYISKKELVRVNEEFTGDFYGIGVQFTIIRDTVMVVKVIDDGPSQKADILAGDRIIGVNSENFTGKKINNSLVMNTLRGKRGEKVELKIFRKNKEFKKTLYRDAIPLNSIEASYLIKDNIGYIKLDKFSATTYNEFKDAISDLKKKGATKLVLDLRDNTGGYLGQAVDVVNEFLDGNLEIVSTEGNSRSRQTYYSNNNGKFKKGDIVILINEESASASEIVAGAIQDHDRGLVVGKKSYGKGLVGEQFLLSDGSAVRMTIAKYYTPSGRCIQKPYRSSDTIVSNQEFKTKGGRVVFSEGGITPDYIISSDTMSDFESDFWNKNYNVLYEKAFDFADSNRIELTLDYRNVFKKNRENFVSEIFPPNSGFVPFSSTNNIITQFENMILNQILSTEELIYHYNKDDEYLEKALEILLI